MRQVGHHPGLLVHNVPAQGTTAALQTPEPTPILASSSGGSWACPSRRQRSARAFSAIVIGPGSWLASSVIGHALGSEEWAGYDAYGFAHAERVGFVEQNAWKEKVASGRAGAKSALWALE